MSYYDSDILIENIKSHMNEKGITQEKLAVALGMSQSNVSKALNTKDKKSFTLDQVVDIAKFFHVSVDSLIGEKGKYDISVTPRSIATFLVQMIESDNAILFEHGVNKEIYEVDDNNWPPTCNHKNKEINYLAIYLPSYWHITSELPYETQSDLYCEMTQIGNDTSLKPVNEFLHHFQEIYDIYKKGGLSEDTYRSVLSYMLNRLRY